MLTTTRGVKIRPFGISREPPFYSYDSYSMTSTHRILNVDKDSFCAIFCLVVAMPLQKSQPLLTLS